MNILCISSVNYLAFFFLKVFKKYIIGLLSVIIQNTDVDKT